MQIQTPSSDTRKSQTIQWLSAVAGSLFIGATVIGLLLLTQYLCQELISGLSAMPPRELVRSLAGTS